MAREVGFLLYFFTMASPIIVPEAAVPEAETKGSEPNHHYPSNMIHLLITHSCSQHSRFSFHIPFPSLQLWKSPGYLYLFLLYLPLEAGSKLR
jgi:hypothetical protein